MPVVTIIDVRGGCGATTLSAALADTLSLQGEEVLAMDFDHSNELRLHLGMPWEVDDGLAPRARNGEDWGKAAWRSPNGAWFIAYGHDPQIDEDPPWNPRAEWLDGDRQALPLTGDAWVLIHTPPWPHAHILPALRMADLVLLIATPEPSAHARLVNCMPRIEASSKHLAEDDRLLLAFNRYRPGHALHEDLLRVAQARFGERMSPVAIPEDPRVAEALAMNANIVEYAPHSAAGSRIAALALWLKSRLRASAGRLSA